MTLKHPFLIAAVLLSAGGAIAGATTFSVLNTYLNTPLGGDDAGTTSTTPQTTSSASDRGPSPLYFTIMSHMEGNFKDDTVEALFQKHTKDIRWAMDLFDEYDVKLTIESEESFAKANTVWDDNILADVIAQGHGVGTHADVGADSRNVLSLNELTSELKERKSLVDNLVGAENNYGLSGGTGPTDWVLAASGAGFHYMDAVTGFGYLSMDESERPSGWTNAYILETGYHDPIPVDFSERIYPLTLADATDLIADDPGVITVMGGDIGELASIAEGRSNCFPDCTFDQDDIDEVEHWIQEADQIRDRSKFARVNIHIPLILLNERNETLLRSFLSMLKTYADDGRLQFATEKGSYDAFVEWENVNSN